MTDIPQDPGLEGLSLLKQYGYTTAEEVFYLAQALGPELAELTGIAPLELQSKLAPTLSLLSQALVDELSALELPMGVPLDETPPQPLPFVFPPVAVTAAAQVNLIGEMPPVRKQGERGTCVAHAALAVAEHRFARMGAPIDLSEQFLYWDCKQNDGIPTKSGTWLQVAFPLLARDGTCPEINWPYQPLPCPREDCGPPPSGAIQAALTYRHAIRQVPRGSVTDIKAELAAGNCVAFSIPVFRSWYRSDLVRATGTINMPVPNDINEGGHAMCLVGYEDSNGLGLGGGRFVLRNSWGTEWAPQSLHGAGYGSIPYAYIERYCSEAFTLA